MTTTINIIKQWIMDNGLYDYQPQKPPYIYNGSMINNYPYEMIWIMITTITLLKSGSWINDS